MAQHLLLTTMMNVTEVADAVGYADAKYFSRVFRKHLGIRPPISVILINGGNFH